MFGSPVNIRNNSNMQTNSSNKAKRRSIYRDDGFSPTNDTSNIVVDSNPNPPGGTSMDSISDIINVDMYKKASPSIEYLTNSTSNQEKMSPTSTFYLNNDNVESHENLKKLNLLHADFTDVPINISNINKKKGLLNDNSMNDSFNGNYSNPASSRNSPYKQNILNRTPNNYDAFDMPSTVQSNISLSKKHGSTDELKSFNSRSDEYATFNSVMNEDIIDAFDDSGQFHSNNRNEQIRHDMIDVNKIKNKKMNTNVMNFSDTFDTESSIQSHVTSNNRTPDTRTNSNPSSFTNPNIYSNVSFTDNLSKQSSSKKYNDKRVVIDRSKKNSNDDQLYGFDDNLNSMHSSVSNSVSSSAHSSPIQRRTMHADSKSNRRDTHGGHSGLLHGILEDDSDGDDNHSNYRHDLHSNQRNHPISPSKNKRISHAINSKNVLDPLSSFEVTNESHRGDIQRKVYSSFDESDSSFDMKIENTLTERSQYPPVANTNRMNFKQTKLNDHQSFVDVNTTQHSFNSATLPDDDIAFDVSVTNAHSAGGGDFGKRRGRDGISMNDGYDMDVVSFSESPFVNNTKNPKNENNGKKDDKLVQSKSNTNYLDQLTITPVPAIPKFAGTDSSKRHTNSKELFDGNHDRREPISMLNTNDFVSNTQNNSTVINPTNKDESTNRERNVSVDMANSWDVESDIDGEIGTDSGNVVDRSTAVTLPTYSIPLTLKQDTASSIELPTKTNATATIPKTKTKPKSMFSMTAIESSFDADSSINTSVNESKSLDPTQTQSLTQSIPKSSSIDSWNSVSIGKGGDVRDNITPNMDHDDSNQQQDKSTRRDTLPPNMDHDDSNQQQDKSSRRDIHVHLDALDRGTNKSAFEVHDQKQALNIALHDNEPDILMDILQPTDQHEAVASKQHSNESEVEFVDISLNSPTYDGNTNVNATDSNANTNTNADPNSHLNINQKPQISAAITEEKPNMLRKLTSWWTRDNKANMNSALSSNRNLDNVNKQDVGDAIDTHKQNANHNTHYDAVNSKGMDSSVNSVSHPHSLMKSIEDPLNEEFDTGTADGDGGDQHSHRELLVQNTNNNRLSITNNGINRNTKIVKMPVVSKINASTANNSGNSDQHSISNLKKKTQSNELPNRSQGNRVSFEDTTINNTSGGRSSVVKDNVSIAQANTQSMPIENKSIRDVPRLKLSIDPCEDRSDEKDEILTNEYLPTHTLFTQTTVYPTLLECVRQNPGLLANLIRGELNSDSINRDGTVAHISMSTPLVYENIPEITLTKQYLTEYKVNCQQDSPKSPQNIQKNTELPQQSNITHLSPTNKRLDVGTEKRGKSAEALLTLQRAIERAGNESENCLEIWNEYSTPKAPTENMDSCRKDLIESVTNIKKPTFESQENPLRLSIRQSIERVSSKIEFEQTANKSNKQWPLSETNSNMKMEAAQALQYPVPNSFEFYYQRMQPKTQMMKRGVQDKPLNKQQLSLTPKEYVQQQYSCLLDGAEMSDQSDVKRIQECEGQMHKKSGNVINETPAFLLQKGMSGKWGKNDMRKYNDDQVFEAESVEDKKNLPNSNNSVVDVMPNENLLCTEPLDDRLHTTLNPNDTVMCSEANSTLTNSILLNNTTGNQSMIDVLRSPPSSTSKMNGRVGSIRDLNHRVMVHLKENSIWNSTLCMRLHYQIVQMKLKSNFEHLYVLRKKKLITRHDTPNVGNTSSHSIPSNAMHDIAKHPTIHRNDTMDTNLKQHHQLHDHQEELLQCNSGFISSILPFYASKYEAYNQAMGILYAGELEKKTARTGQWKKIYASLEMKRINRPNTKVSDNTNTTLNNNTHSTTKQRATVANVGVDEAANYHYCFNLYDKHVVGSYGVFALDLHRCIEFPVPGSEPDRKDKGNLNTSESVVAAGDQCADKNHDRAFNSETVHGSGEAGERDAVINSLNPTATDAQNPSDGSTVGNSSNNTNGTEVSDYSPYMRNTIISVVSDPHPSKHGLEFSVTYHSSEYRIATAQERLDNPGMKAVRLIRVVVYRTKHHKETLAWVTFLNSIYMLHQ